ncbi:MAG: hypothetical protein V2B20_25155 [Pseudomonadota bacterium]
MPDFEATCAKGVTELHRCQRYDLATVERYLGNPEAAEDLLIRAVAIATFLTTVQIHDEILISTGKKYIGTPYPIRKKSLFPFFIIC